MCCLESGIEGQCNVSLNGETCQSMLYIRCDILEVFKEATVSRSTNSRTTKHEETLLPFHNHKADHPPSPLKQQPSRPSSPQNRQPLCPIGPPLKMKDCQGRVDGRVLGQNSRVGPK